VPLHVFNVLLVLTLLLVLQDVLIVQQVHMLLRQEQPHVPLARQELTPPPVPALVLLALQEPLLQLVRVLVLHVQ
jgi:hypothetical protein